MNYKQTTLPPGVILSVARKLKSIVPPSELWVMEEGATPLIVEVALFTHAD
jgi:hypothetical protein